MRPLETLIGKGFQSVHICGSCAGAVIVYRIGGMIAPFGCHNARNRGIIDRPTRAASEVRANKEREVRT